MTLYHYVGPKWIADRIHPERLGVEIRSPDDVRAWVRNSGQKLSAGCVIATFIVDETGVLRIADRRSEHVACAGGGPVRSAGEITFAISQTVEAIEVSNQSIGYCPEPESWLAVSEALSRAGITAPFDFSPACAFRRCLKCGSVTLVKDISFECGMCGADLPADYNVQEPWLA